jgi:cytochrome P450
MALNPAAQRRAQAEIDAVVGLHRLPELEEKNTLKLPYVEAVIKETHRWNPPGNLGESQIYVRCI